MLHELYTMNLFSQDEKRSRIVHSNYCKTHLDPDKKCVTDMVGSFTAATLKELCVCPPQCKEITYSSVISTATWPSRYGYFVVSTSQQFFSYVLNFVR